jgi:hypothetical protein
MLWCPFSYIVSGCCNFYEPPTPLCMIPFRRLSADFAHFLQQKWEAVDIGKHAASGECGLDVLVNMLGSNVILTMKKAESLGENC